MKPFVFNLARPMGNWRENASNFVQWQEWDRQWRHKLGWRAGLAFWKKTNVKGSRVLLSRHWPHRLCWSWSIWVGVARPEYDGPNRFFIVIMRPYRNVQWRIWRFIGSVHWQDSDHMAALGRYRDGAPKIYWKQRLANAEPAGTA